MLLTKARKHVSPRRRPRTDTIEAALTTGDLINDGVSELHTALPASLEAQSTHPHQYDAERSKHIIDTHEIIHERASDEQIGDHCT